MRSKTLLYGGPFLLAAMTMLPTALGCDTLDPCNSQPLLQGKVQEFVDNCLEIVLEVLR